MEKNSINQKAGNNSSQYQIEKVEINTRISIEEWKELLSEENKLAIANSQLIAESIAKERLQEYSDILLPKLVKAEMLSCFSDPSIQFLFRQTQKTALCSDRECDYEMLSEMLIHKIENKSNYTISAAIEKAINEVNNISEESLMMLTIIYAVTTYTPNGLNMSQGLNILNDLYGKLLNNFEFPSNFQWLDNLEVTNSIRIGNIGGSKKLDDYLAQILSQYTQKGIRKDSENYTKAIEELKANDLPIHNLVENELDSNYCKLPLSSKSEINDTYLVRENNGKVIKIELSDNQKKALMNVYNLYENGNLNDKFKNELYKYENINKIIDWWNENMINISFNLTSIGKVLACTNARRIDSSLPKM